MIDPTLISTAIVIIISAIGTVTVTIINAWAAARDRIDSAEQRRVLYEKAILAAKSQEDVSKKADTIIEKAAEIHTLTNSANSELRSQLALMTEKYNGLLRMIEEIRNSKVLQQDVRIPKLESEK